MPDTTRSRPQLMNDNYVREVIERLGGVNALLDDMHEFHEIVKRMDDERACLTEKHPDRWVAMGSQGVLAIGDSMEEVLAQVERQGLRGADVVIELLDTDPPLLIL